MTAPVVLIAFNRPDVTRRTLQRIREAAPSRLLLIADGPRPGREDDAANCAAVRAELDAVDWPCEVHRRFSDANQGTPATVELGLDWVFGQVEEAIILEDDCLPSADFFRFCTELLDRYSGTEQVWQMTGRPPNAPARLFDGVSYRFTAFGAIWGWATWRRAWVTHRKRFPRMHDGSPERRPAPGDLKASSLVTRAGRRYFGDVAKEPVGQSFSWDSYWCLSVINERGLVASPAANLIENTGFGADATNAKNAIRQRQLEPIDWPLSHPPELAVDPQVERACERVITYHHGRAARFVARRLPQGRVRKVTRSAVGALREWRLRA